MSQINTGRVIVGGLLAGVVMNASEAALHGGMLGQDYAAMRPRFGPGPRTAIYAGLAVWVLSHVWSGIYLGSGFAGLIPARMAFLPIAWGLVEAPLGTLVGAWVYRE